MHGYGFQSGSGGWFSLNFSSPFGPTGHEQNFLVGSNQFELTTATLFSLKKFTTEKRFKVPSIM